MIASLQPNLLARSAQVKTRAKEMGFDLVGIASAEPSQWRQYFQRWLADGMAGEMNYLANRLAERTQPGTYVPGAQSVVCVAINYYVPLEPAPSPPAVPGKIAR